MFTARCALNYLMQLRLWVVIMKNVFYVIHCEMIEMISIVVS